VGLRKIWSPDWVSLCEVNPGIKLRALVYNILPPATAIIGYAVGLGKLPAVEQFFIGSLVLNGSKFLTDNSVYVRRFFYNCPRCLRKVLESDAPNVPCSQTSKYFIDQMLWQEGFVFCMFV